MQLSTLSTQLVSWLISHSKDRISWQTAVVGDDSDSLPVHNFPIRNKARVRAGNSNGSIANFILQLRYVNSTLEWTHLFMLDLLYIYSVKV